MQLHRLRVEHRLPQDWEILQAGAPLVCRDYWLRAMLGGIDGIHTWFLLDHQQAPCMGLFGLLVSDPSQYAMFNIRTILMGEASVFRLDETGLDRQALLRATYANPKAWFPNLVVTYPGYDCFPIGPCSESPQALQAMVDGITDWAATQEACLISFLYTRRASTELRAVLERSGFTQVPLTRYAELRLPGNSFDEYLQALPRKRRWGVRAERRALQEAGIRSSVQSLAVCMDQLVELRCRQMTRYGHSRDPETTYRRQRMLLQQVLDQFADRHILICAHTGDHILAYAIFLKDESRWYSLVAGRDEEDPRSHNAYFETTFYHPIEILYTQEQRRISYGLEAEKAKRWRGCSLEMVDGWVRGLTPDLHDAVVQVAEVFRAWEARTESDADGDSTS